MGSRQHPNSMILWKFPSLASRLFTTLQARNEKGSGWFSVLSVVTTLVSAPPISLPEAEKDGAAGLSHRHPATYHTALEVDCS